MKSNELKVKLIKIDGINIFPKAKGILESDKQIVRERKGFLFRDIQNYSINTQHLKRDTKGKPVFFIDLKTHKSINPHTTEKADIKGQNALGYLMQEKNWKARQQNKKIDKWTALIILFAGMGLYFLITSILGRIF